MVSSTNIYYGVIGALSALVVGFSMSAAGFFSDKSSLWGGLSIAGAGLTAVGVVITIIYRERRKKQNQKSIDNGQSNNNNTNNSNQ